MNGWSGVEREQDVERYCESDRQKSEKHKNFIENVVTSRAPAFGRSRQRSRLQACNSRARNDFTHREGRKLSTGSHPLACMDPYGQGQYGYGSAQPSQTGTSQQDPLNQQSQFGSAAQRAQPQYGAQQVGELSSTSYLPTQ